MSKVLNGVFLAFAAAMIAVVGFGDPGAVSRTVNDFFGWEPDKPVAAKLVSADEAVEIRALVGSIKPDEVAAEIERFAAFGSRVPASSMLTIKASGTGSGLRRRIALVVLIISKRFSEERLIGASTTIKFLFTVRILFHYSTS